MKILAWLGLSFVLIGLLASTADSINYSRGINIGFGGGYAIAITLGFLGILLALIGGLSVKPSHFWLFSLIVGILYVVSFSGYFLNFKPSIMALLLNLLPGFVLIVEGVGISYISRREKTTKVDSTGF